MTTDAVLSRARVFLGVGRNPVFSDKTGFSPRGLRGRGRKSVLFPAQCLIPGRRAGSFCLVDFKTVAAFFLGSVEGMVGATEQFRRIARGRAFGEDGAGAECANRSRGR